MAHIELIGVLPSNTCSSIDARMIECWEIQNTDCPLPNTLLTIPTCNGCPKIQTQVGNEYIIAGVQQKKNSVKSLVLPNEKQTGLFGPWKARYNVNIPVWVENARNNNNN